MNQGQLSTMHHCLCTLEAKIINLLAHIHKSHTIIIKFIIITLTIFSSEM